MPNSADPDQLASEANWSGSTLFEKQGISGLSRTRVNTGLRRKGTRYTVSVAVTLSTLFCPLLKRNLLYKERFCFVPERLISFPVEQTLFQKRLMCIKTNRKSPIFSPLWTVVAKSPRLPMNFDIRYISTGYMDRWADHCFYPYEKSA